MAATQNLTDLTVHLPADVARLVSEAVSTGEFANPSDLVEEALRAWMEHRVPVENVAYLREVWQHAIARNGPYVDGKEMFVRLKKHYQDKLDGAETAQP